MKAIFVTSWASLPQKKEKMQNPQMPSADFAFRKRGEEKWKRWNQKTIYLYDKQKVWRKKGVNVKKILSFKKYYKNKESGALQGENVPNFTLYEKLPVKKEKMCRKQLIYL